MKSRRMKWAGYVPRMGEKRNAYGLLVGKPEGKRPLGRPKRRWVDITKMDLLEIGWGVVTERNYHRAECLRRTCKQKTGGRQQHLLGI
jgi:hypothetical protein